MLFLIMNFFKGQKGQSKRESNVSSETSPEKSVTAIPQVSVSPTNSILTKPIAGGSYSPIVNPTLMNNPRSKQLSKSELKEARLQNRKSVQELKARLSHASKKSAIRRIHIGTIHAKVGRIFNFPVPFHLVETPKSISKKVQFQLRTKENQPLYTNAWISYDSKMRRVVGFPLAGNEGTSQFLLMPFVPGREIEENQEEKQYFLTVHVTGTVNEFRHQVVVHMENFLALITQLRKRMIFVELLVSYLNKSGIWVNTGDIWVAATNVNTGTLTWILTAVHTNTCDPTITERLPNTLTDVIVNDKKPTPELVKALDGKFVVTEIDYQLEEPCEFPVTIHENKPQKFLGPMVITIVLVILLSPLVIAWAVRRRMRIIRKEFANPRSVYVNGNAKAVVMTQEDIDEVLDESDQRKYYELKYRWDTRKIDRSAVVQADALRRLSVDAGYLSNNADSRKSSFERRASLVDRKSSEDSYQRAHLQDHHQGSFWTWHGLPKHQLHTATTPASQISNKLTDLTSQISTKIGLSNSMNSAICSTNSMTSATSTVKNIQKYIPGKQETISSKPHFRSDSTTTSSVRTASTAVENKRLVQADHSSDSVANFFQNAVNKVSSIISRQSSITSSRSGVEEFNMITTETLQEKRRKLSKQQNRDQPSFTSSSSKDSSSNNNSFYSWSSYSSELFTSSRSSHLSSVEPNSSCEYSSKPSSMEWNTSCDLQLSDISRKSSFEAHHLGTANNIHRKVSPYEPAAINNRNPYLPQLTGDSLYRNPSPRSLQNEILYEESEASGTRWMQADTSDYYHDLTDPRTAADFERHDPGYELGFSIGNSEKLEEPSRKTSLARRQEFLNRRMKTISESTTSAAHISDGFTNKDWAIGTPGEWSLRSPLHGDMTHISPGRRRSSISLAERIFESSESEGARV